MKNCGPRFHKHIATKDFLNDFMKLLTQKVCAFVFGATIFGGWSYKLMCMCVYLCLLGFLTKYLMGSEVRQVLFHIFLLLAENLVY